MTKHDLTISTGSHFSKRFLIQDSEGAVVNLSGYSAYLYIIKSMGAVSTVVFSTISGQLTIDALNGYVYLTLSPAEIETIDGTFYKLEIVDSLGYETEVVTGNIFLLYENKISLDFLIPFVRIKIGDLDTTAYRYLDEWIHTALILSVRSLRNYFGVKYIVDDFGVVSRDARSTKFSTDVSEGVIEMQDEYIIVLKASIIILQGGLESSAWNLVSWRDNEISVSNQEVSRTKSANLRDLLNEFSDLVLPPNKRLARAKKGSLPGYLGNIWEHKTDF